MRVPLLARTVDGYGTLTMLVAMFFRAVLAIILVVMHSSGNTEPDTSNFGVIFGGIMYTQTVNSLILLVVKVRLLPIMFELVRFCRLHYFVLQR